MLNLNEYQVLASATRNPELDRDTVMANCALGLCNESMELIEHLLDSKYEFRDPTEYAEALKAKLVDEAGDVMWYSSGLADSWGLMLSDVVPDGFSAPGSVEKGVTPKARVRARWFLLCMRAGDIGNTVKKHVYQRHPLNEAKIVELRSALRIIVECVRVIVTLCGSDLKTCCEGNIAKLRKRYPDGKFSAESSVHRVA